MKITHTLSAAALATAFAAPAFAGGMTPVAEEPMIAPAPVMAAPSYDWTGGYAGAQLGYGDVGDVLDGDGWLGGVHAGYMWDFGSYVLGGEVDWDGADIDLNGGAGSLDSVARLKLRAGWDAGRTLLYATAGAAHASAEVGGTDFSDTGWFAGLGAAYQVTDQWVVGGEILEHRFDDFDDTGIDVDATTATLRASFRF